MLHLLVGVNMEGESQTCERMEGNHCLGLIWAESPQRRDTGEISIFFFGGEASQVALEVKNPPGESHGQRSLMGHGSWRCKGLDMTEAT